MTEREMWRTVAEAYGTPRSKRTDEQLAMTVTGLCRAAFAVCPRRRPKSLTRLGFAMGCAGFWWHTRTMRSPHDGERALFAGFLAAMTDRERAQLWEGL